MKKPRLLAIHLVVFSIWLVAASASAQVEFDDPGTYVLKRSWTMQDMDLPGTLGGMFFAPHRISSTDTLYVVGNANSSTGALFALDVTRDPATHEITDLDDPELIFSGDREASQIAGLHTGWAFGPEGTLFYAYSRNQKLGQRPGGVAGVERIFDLSRTGLENPQAAGVTFSPYIDDPLTGFGMMQISDWHARYNRVWNVPLMPLGNGYFEPQAAQVLATLPSLSGGLAYIPSGPDTGDLLVADPLGGDINILFIDKETGWAVDSPTNQPTLGTTAPKFKRFAGGMSFPSGLMFDPITGDLFFSTGGRSVPPNTLYQVGGFPPPVEGGFFFPTALFVADPDTGAAPLEVRFDASTSITPAETTITRYEWDFGDGAVAEGERVSHAYTEAGRYLVSLWVTNDSDRRDRKRSVLEIRCPSSDISPWTFGAVGEPAFPGSARLEGEDQDRCLVLCAGGQDISGETEDFSFVHTETTGDVLLTAQVSEMASPDGRAKVGIMFRESLDIGSPFVAMFVENTGNGEGHFGFSYRDPRGIVRTRRGLSAELPDAWIRIRREGAEFTGLSSTDGVTWCKLHSVVLDLRAEEMLGGVVATGIDSEPPSSPFEPLTATVCNLEVSPGGDVDGPVKEIQFLDLSDIIAGGDGTGVPEDALFVGVHLDTGEFLRVWEDAPTFEFDGINPSPVDDSDFIDSVFFLNQADMSISTADVPFDFDPVDPFNSSNNHVLANITGNLDADGVIQAGDRKDLETSVGLIAAAGVTFDLRALRAEHGVDAIHTFTSYLGMDGHIGCQVFGVGFMTFYVMFSNEDEILMDPTTEDGAVWKFRVPRISGVGTRYDAVIPPEATFLTLVSGAGNNDNDSDCDRGVFGNPRIYPRREPPPIRFRRGDPTSDGRTDVSDSLAILNFLFGNGPVPTCMKSADVDDTGAVNLVDPVLILNYLFGGGAAPVAPFGVCGTDAGELSCESYPACG